MNRLLREKLEQAEKVYQEMQTALLKAEKAYTELRLKVDAMGTGGSVGLSQFLFPTIKEPNTFNGDKANNLDDWLESMALWLRHRGVTQDEKKIETAMTYLRGTAKKAMQGYFDKVNDQKSLGTYATFIEELKKGFQQMDNHSTWLVLNRPGRRQIVGSPFPHTLTPPPVAGTNAQNCGKFSAQFRTLAKQTGFSNAELLSKLYTHVPKPAADILIACGYEKWAKTWDEFINEVQEILQDSCLLNGTVLTSQIAKDPNAMDVDAVKGKKSSDKADGKQAKVWKMAMLFEKKECLNGKESNSSSASSSKNTDTPGASSSKASSSSSKGKEKDTGKLKYTKKSTSTREMHGSDSDRFEELDLEDGSGSSSEEETPKPRKKKSSSDKKVQRVNRVVFSDDEDFLKGPM
ncbi:hypothetical protein CERSUDRAFT_95467 [Gelatoporia subvermispora B]|uniref:Uncharacterized protein n=1 Tax=Ceriporiopsis subvermispora (strain B) TaxID=914234 RepID=M2QJJ1_CERS8|nr:hypothetical protein CERSUDRAFT_95467 [Gelatoporia subvermispora B]